MSFKSYKKSSSRPFDHLYDQNYICSKARLRKLNVKALYQTAPIHLIPCYHYLFSDHQRNFRLPQRNPLPFDASPQNCESFKHEKYFNKNLFVIAPKCEASHVGVKVEEEIPPEIKFRSIKCQTKYRESEAQTDPYLPDAKLAVGEKFIPEIASTSVTNLPNLKDIETIERTRCRRKWQENLSYATMQEKIEQLKVIEYENFLTHEKEMNELQEERLQHVLKMFDDRMNATKMINDEILESTRRKSFCDAEMKKKEMREKMERKLRQMAKAHGLVDDDKNFMKAHVNERGDNGPRFEKFDVKNPKKIKLSFSKSNEEKFKKIFDVLQKNRLEKCKKDKIKCIKERKIQEIFEDPSFHVIDASNDQDKILVQRTLKGKAIQNKILRELNLMKIEVIKNQSLYPIKKLEGIVPKIIFEYPKLEVEPEEISPPQTPPEDHLKSVINYAVEQAKQLINTKILNEAEKLRQARRKIQERQEMEASLRQAKLDEIKTKLDELYDRMTCEIIDRITPIAIELIAEKDAQKFIIQKAKEIDDATKMPLNDFELEEEVERALNEVLIPHVEKFIEEKAENEMSALIAANDLFEDILKLMSRK